MFHAVSWLHLGSSEVMQQVVFSTTKRQITQYYADKWNFLVICCTILSDII